MSFLLPGWGQKKEGCGRVIRGVACKPTAQTRLTDGKHVARVVLSRCGRAACPDCYTAWASREGERAENRLKEAYRLRPGLGPVKHVVISPPKNLHGMEVGKLRALVREVAAAVGWKGGLEVFHPWRTKAKGKGKYRRGLNYYSPHFHLVGFGWLVTSKVPPGWLVKNLGVRDSVSGTVEYLLDHAGVVPGQHVARWTGELGNNKMRVVEVRKVEEVIKCPCGASCHEYQAHNEIVDWTRDMGPAIVKKKVRIFMFVNRSKKDSRHKARRQKKLHVDHGEAILGGGA